MASNTSIPRVETQDPKLNTVRTILTVAMFGTPSSMAVYVGVFWSTGALFAPGPGRGG